MRSPDRSPIFIHSLFRSGSTYLFNVFSRSESGYWCYQEPLNEHLLNAASSPDELLELDTKSQKYLRHPDLNRPYFQEFHSIADDVGRLLQKEFCYDQYFSNEDSEIVDLTAYFSLLVGRSNGRPVFQCCRTTGRVQNLISGHGGIHIFLYRNPWDQWWSYKKSVYFDASNLLISYAKNAPESIRIIRKDLGIPRFHNKDILLEYGHYSRPWLGAVGSYKLFYSLWCHAMLEAKPRCQLSIDIDRLSISNSYQKSIVGRLDEIGIDGLDFSDCAVPMANYGECDHMFFDPIEVEVHSLLLSNGFSREQVRVLELLSDKRRSRLVNTKTSGEFSARDGMRAREYARSSESRLAETHQSAITQQQQAEERTVQAKEQTQLAMTRLRELHDSHSWKITAPMRWIGRQAHLLRKHGVLERVDALLRSIVRYLLRGGAAFVHSYPALEKRFASLATNSLVPDFVKNIFARLSIHHRESKHLSPYARRIYADLKSACSKTKNLEDN